MTHNEGSCALGLALPGPEALDELPGFPEGADQTHDSPDVIHQHLMETNNILVCTCGEGEGEINRPSS